MAAPGNLTPAFAINELKDVKVFELKDDTNNVLLVLVNAKEDATLWHDQLGGMVQCCRSYNVSINETRIAVVHLNENKLPVSVVGVFDDASHLTTAIGSELYPGPPQVDVGDVTLV